MSPDSIAPISSAASALRVQTVGLAEAGHVAAVGAALQAHTPPPAVAPRPAPPLPPPATDAARAQAAGRQASLAPLFAELAQAVRSPRTPTEIKVAIDQVLALQLPATGPLTAQTLQQAVARSGLFLEAHLAQAAPPAAPDLKAALLVLRQLVSGPPGEAVPPDRAANAPPPAREAALTAQPPAPATLPADASATTVAQHLHRDLDQAIARQILHQLASLPDGSPTGWMFELPVATPQGSAIAQFEIDRDGHATSEGGGAAPWRVRFSIDVEPLGPVHVHLAYSRDHAAVTVWAEREETLERLRDQGEALARALPGEVVFRPGAPHPPLPSRGAFLDRKL